MNIELQTTKRWTLEISSIAAKCNCVSHAIVLYQWHASWICAEKLIVAIVRALFQIMTFIMFNVSCWSSWTTVRGGRGKHMARLMTCAFKEIGKTCLPRAVSANNVVLDWRSRRWSSRQDTKASVDIWPLTYNDMYIGGDLCPWYEEMMMSCQWQ